VQQILMEMRVMIPHLFIYAKGRSLTAGVEPRR
jgi:hypothetical protein